MSLCEAQAVTRSAPLKRTRAETVARAHTLGTRSGWKSESTGTGTVVEDRTLARPGGEPLVPAGRGAGRRRGSRQAPPSRRLDRLRLGGWGSGCGAWRPAPVNPSEVRSDVREEIAPNPRIRGKGGSEVRRALDFFVLEVRVVGDLEPVDKPVAAVTKVAGWQLVAPAAHALLA